ncbi:Gtpase-Activating Rap/Ran-Gap Domain-Like Protein 3 [Manis pentadactyla]|nr:Gtpase-Activating Rap/Ran-Gap Domain-Like Protein 3 [Manis pentadactyla]
MLLSGWGTEKANEQIGLHFQFTTYPSLVIAVSAGTLLPNIIQKSKVKLKKIVPQKSCIYGEHDYRSMDEIINSVSVG